MKIIKLEEVYGFFPITLQFAQKIEQTNSTIHDKPVINAKSYQSKDVNEQQLYKPISKIY